MKLLINPLKAIFFITIIIAITIVIITIIVNNTNIIIITVFISLIICFAFNLFSNCIYYLIFPYSLFFFMPQVKDQKSYSLHLILFYFVFMTSIFRLILFKIYGNN